MKEGLNLIKIKVISEDNTKSNEYIIKVTKTNDIMSANTSLETLAIQDVLVFPTFDNSVTRYTAKIGNDVTKLNILAIPQNEKAKIEIKGNENLKEGNNKIVITVVAVNGFTKRDYIINTYKRNIKEEQEYKENKIKQKEKLEQIYQAQRVSTNVIKNKEETNSKVIYFFIFIIFIIIIAFFSYRKLHLK